MTKAGGVQGTTGHSDRFTAHVGEPVGREWVVADRLFWSGLPAAAAGLARLRGARSSAVAASLLFEQYCLRIIPPVLANLYLKGIVLDTDLHAVRVRVGAGALEGVAFAAEAVQPGPPAVADAVGRLINDNLEPVAAAVHEQTRAGLRVLRGAVANAVANALLHLSWARPDHAYHLPDAHALLELIPAGRRLVNVRAVDVGGQAWLYTDRNTCCQAFRTTVNQAREQKVCATCPLRPRAETEAMFVRAVESYASRRHEPPP